MGAIMRMWNQFSKHFFDDIVVLSWSWSAALFNPWKKISIMMLWLRPWFMELKVKTISGSLNGEKKCGTALPKINENEGKKT